MFQHFGEAKCLALVGIGNNLAIGLGLILFRISKADILRNTVEKHQKPLVNKKDPDEGCRFLKKRLLMDFRKE
jgi:hypothetical protein